MTKPIMRALASATLLILLASPFFAQSPATPPAANPAAATASTALPVFVAADVHVSTPSRVPYMRGCGWCGDRYTIRQATLVDLVATAYGVENANVIGGPAWTNTDRFDINATAPSTTSSDDVKLMLRALLADRFKLAFHNDSRPQPAFVLTVGKGGSKLKQSDGTASSGCGISPSQPPPTPGVPSDIYVSCHNLTADQIAQNLHQMAGGYLTKPVVNSTDLKGPWDFDIRWTGAGALTAAGADGISIFDAVDKQLGLKLEAKTAPMPAIVVDSVNEQPTPNVPGIEKILPPPPPAVFDVAVITPSKPGTMGPRIQIGGSQVNITGATLRFLIVWAWKLNGNNKESLVGAPRWLDQDKFDILAKVAPDSEANNLKTAPPIDPDDLRRMIQTLLADRFQLKSHREDRPQDAYTLVAVNPKLKKGDPAMSAGCKEGPGPDGKDPRLTNPMLGRLITCQNTTMAEFGMELVQQAGDYIYNLIVDRTGLQGGYDFTLSFSGAGQLLTAGAPPPGGDPTTASSASDPSGGLSLFDAVNKQLGLKLVKEKRPYPALVIDHIEEKPIDN